MLLTFIYFVLFILHIHFLLRNILFDIDESQFFMFTMTYQFPKYIAIQSLFFVLLCLLFFTIGYGISYRKSEAKKIQSNNIPSTEISRNEITVLNCAAILIILFVTIIGIFTGFNYGAMTLLRESYGFIFELRIVYLLLLSHILLNIPWRVFIAHKKYKLTRLILIVYLISLLLFQARSAIFELGACILIPLLMWRGDRVRFSYFFILAFLLILPNILVLSRIGIPDNFNDLVDGIFSIEYSLILNKFLGAAIYTEYSSTSFLSFSPQIGLILPSPIRNLLGLEANNTDYILDLSSLAGITGGGFSLLAQFYTDFGWYSPLVFLSIGLLLGKSIKNISKVGQVKIKHSFAPLFYAMFILTLRNDFGVFLKYSIQLLFLAYILNIFIKCNKTFKLNYNAHGQHVAFKQNLQ